VCHDPEVDQRFLKYLEALEAILGTALNVVKNRIPP